MFKVLICDLHLHVLFHVIHNSNYMEALTDVFGLPMARPNKPIWSTDHDIIPGGRHSLIWAVRGCAAGQGMVFSLSL